MDTFIDAFHFLRPWWLLALLPVAGLLGLLWRSHYSSQQWLKHISPALLPTLLQGGVQRSNGLLLAAIAFCWLASCLALAGPVWQKQPSPVVQNTDALVIAWDLSPSMMAEDISPSRLVRSRLKIIDLLKARPDGQTALIAFSGEAYTVTPLTDDSQTIINLLPALAPNTLPSLGSNPEMAYSQAAELLTQAGIAKGQILMITDEITTDALATLKELVAASSHKLTLWGLGTADGAPVPWGKEGFARDNSGAIAMAKLNEDELRAFAVETHSYYVPMVSDGSDINALQSLINNANAHDTQSEESTEQLFDQWVEHGHWLIWACLPLLLIGFRRGWLLGVAIIVLPYSAISPPLAQADPFKTDDQAGFDAYQKHDYDKAAKHFKDPHWQATAQYRNGNYAEAAKIFSQQNTVEAKFNQGNAELLQGHFEQAITAYDNALASGADLDSSQREAIQKNKQIAEQLKKKKQEQQKEQDGDSDEKDDKEQGGEKQDSEQKQQGDESSEDTSSDSQQNQQDPSDQDPSEEQNPQQTEQEGSSSSAGASAGKDASEGASSSADTDQSRQGQASSDQGSSDQNSSQSAAEISKAEEPITEEQQMLETLLRKVPDDPSGLLRAKFQQKYRQRQQELRRGGRFDETQKAEKRW
ncbi:vWA domain-containing protein [Marinagarivorans algicola]|uniref:vWA domain-containing protein n=1 Tax=Marinagarivorans algicola TaxID=1513270 RepID=UPI0006B9E56C|nr:VWA domain-containing protein [Marinagarivorans algicola]